MNPNRSQIPAKVKINIQFRFQKAHSAQVQAYIPRSEAIKLPELKLQSRKEHFIEDSNNPESKTLKGQRRKGSEVDEDNKFLNDIDIQNQIQNEEQQDQSKEQQDNYDSDYIEYRQDEMDVEMDSISSESMIKNNSNNKTKRQKGETNDLVSLPNRRSRKDEKVDQAYEISKLEEKNKRRKIYIQKQIEAHEKATLDKILNETGKKLRMREEKQALQAVGKERKVFRTLGNVPKIVTRNNKEGTTIISYDTKLFSDEMTRSHDIKIKQSCSNCGNVSKYKLKNLNSHACSLQCYKILNI